MVTRMCPYPLTFLAQATGVRRRSHLFFFFLGLDVYMYMRTPTIWQLRGRGAWQGTCLAAVAVSGWGFGGWSVSSMPSARVSIPRVLPNCTRVRMSATASGLG